MWPKIHHCFLCMMDYLGLRQLEYIQRMCTYTNILDFCILEMAYTDNTIEKILVEVLGSLHIFLFYFSRLTYNAIQSKVISKIGALVISMSE